jgi:hypothetical protein
MDEDIDTVESLQYSGHKIHKYSGRAAKTTFFLGATTFEMQLKTL